MSSIHADPPPPIVSEPSGINYATGSALGKGGFAICHRAERFEGSKPTGHMVALKIVKTKMEPAKLAQKFVTELQIHSKLAHPNIVTFYRAFSFSTSTYVVLELCPNGSLADMLKRRKYLTLPEIRRFVIQICSAVKYLHHRHIVHRDLKTGNLFLDKNMDIKVGDFGLAALLVSEKHMEATRRTTMCGTPNYLAPEILEKGKGHAEKVDLWAIGVIAYTLAVGKAPFHASTKEEIYKKLKSGAYTWPELSATTNQSSDLRALVSSLLVPEDERPPPDKIVSQNFFKIAFVPQSIPVTARDKAPSWNEVSIPSPEIINRGYSSTWYQLCSESGVGEPSENQPFQMNNGKKVRSIVHDMAREVQAGSQPTMPLDKHTVYISTINSWKGPIDPTQKSTVGARHLKEISHNEVTTSRPEIITKSTTRDADLMPPPLQPTRSVKGGTVRRVARTLSEETAKSEDVFKIATDDLGGLRVAKTRPGEMCQPNSTGGTLKESNFPSMSKRRANTQTKAQIEDEKSSNPVPTRSADASLARRPRAAKPKTRQLSPEESTGPLALLGELKKVSALKSGRPVIQTVSIAENDDNLALPAPPKMNRPLPVPLKTNRISDAIPGSDPDTVLDRLSLFQQNLKAAIKKQNKVLKAAPGGSEVDLPFISRWVDYSRKHGIGYVLSDGTVGCVFNASSKAQTPVTYVFARNGQRLLQRSDRMDQIPLDVFEDHTEHGIVKKAFKGLGSVKDGPLAGEAERHRVLSVLWVKFARYMCQSLEGVEEDVSKNDDNFVRFYQRIGGVGIWAFANGCLQVQFPDHTKVVLSADGLDISATCISTEAAAYLASHGELLPDHVASREVFADSISALLYEGGRIRQRIIKANDLKRKLEFVLDVVSQWLKNEGLGCLDEDVDDGQRLQWDGLTVQTAAKKADRVTVGRWRGDDDLRV